MQTRDNGLLPATVLAVLLVCLLGFSRWVGASFSSVVTAATSLFILGSVLGAAWYFLRAFGWSLSAGFFAFGWPTTWPVLTSIANGGYDSDSSFRPWAQDSFIDSGWMRWGVEFIFVALLCLALVHEYRRRRYW
ncbi:hypothetical protein QYH69_22185 [Paraburkholderia sp. SARCC-3016]|uniref:hypothetical protein n=1 Tax=Paraburkholderia sp. SARCC-3016 TaxID=3058611 RepID=UPI002809228B|nr:hypothetical protein [Paraburkholderia sp. SARCC-3016]MDQ7979954.1 hypothetical protein [Paraburkholderia sp. SARCC-3016]